MGCIVNHFTAAYGEAFKSNFSGSKNFIRSENFCLFVTIPWPEEDTLHGQQIEWSDKWSLRQNFGCK